LIAGNKLHAGRSDGSVFCGTLTGKGLENIVVNELHETLVASPVAIASRLLLRAHEHLCCLKERTVTGRPTRP
jgi:hypothetical protein